MSGKQAARVEPGDRRVRFSAHCGDWPRTRVALAGLGESGLGTSARSGGVKVSRRVRTGVLIVAVLVLLTTDQLTKLWAYSALIPGSSMNLPGPVDLTIVLNRSNAFGIAPDF